MSLRTALLALALVAPVVAQCGSTGVTINEYGSGCSGFGQDPPGLSGSYSAANCAVTLVLSGWGGNCPGICMTQRVLAIGASPAMVPLGFLPCDLLIVPDFLLSFVPAVGDTFVFGLPPVSLAGLQVYIQGGHEFQQGANFEYEVSNGLHLSFF
jgi:hypothetical protein